MKAWHAEHGPLRVAVNLSARQFQQRDLTTMIERILTENDYPPELLDVEITESTAMQNADVSLAVMKRLKQMGVRISIDDFGTGYSSLSYLKRFPIDTVKIDQNFVRDLSDSTNDGAIITAVISMARALNLRVVAEGVETEAQLAFLRRENCEVVQGFLHSRPVSAAEFELSLRADARRGGESFNHREHRGHRASVFSVSSVVKSFSAARIAAHENARFPSPRRCYSRSLPGRSRRRPAHGAVSEGGDAVHVRGDVRAGTARRRGDDCGLPRSGEHLLAAERPGECGALQQPGQGHRSEAAGGAALPLDQRQPLRSVESQRAVHRQRADAAGTQPAAERRLARRDRGVCGRASEREKSGLRRAEPSSSW